MKRIACLAAVLYSLVISFISAGDASSFKLLRKLKITPSNLIDFHLPSRERMEVSGPNVTNIDYGTANAHTDFDQLIDSDVLEAAAPKIVRAKIHHDSAPKISGPSELYSLDAEKLKRNGRHICNSRSSSHDPHDLMSSGTNLTLATAMLNSSKTQNTNWSIARGVAYPNGSRFEAVTSPNQTLVPAHTRHHLAISRRGVPRGQFGHDRPRRSQDSCYEPGCLPPGSVVKCKNSDTVPITKNLPVFLNVFPFKLPFRIRVDLWFAKNESMDKKANRTRAILSVGNTIANVMGWHQFKIEATTRSTSKNWTIIFQIEKESFPQETVSNYTLDDNQFHRLVISVPVGDVLWYVGAAPNCSAFYSPQRDGKKDELSTTTTTTDQTSPTLPADAEQPASPGASRPQLLWLLLLLLIPLMACTAVIIAVMKRKGQEPALNTSRGVQNENISPIYDDICGPIHLNQKTGQMSIDSLCGQVAPDQIKSRSTIISFFDNSARRFDNLQQTSRQNLAGNITAPNECINSGRSGPVDEAHYELYIQANELVNSNIYDNDGEM
ncbi:uncharacterized protein LOC108667714 [Hyalella azteca]|uniref:Uncharacterized protein LOC108667714 n=1 Tax=Hyalella azteca TaxID=294128 RepID=A0A8B7N8T9_HYAAZ|nr:uncharacterized protein LOC108667714 [Hyalella azteca]